MKKLIFLFIVLLVIFIPAFLFASSCNSGGAEYYIKFTTDGQEYLLTYGYPLDISKDAPMLIVWVGSVDDIQIYGTNWQEGIETPEILIDFEGWLHADINGEYLGEYTLEDNGIVGNYAGYGEFHINILDAPYEYAYYSAGGTVTITSFGDVDGAVEGTFEITFDLYVPTALGDSTLDITGDFRLHRISEDDFPYD